MLVSRILTSIALKYQKHFLLNNSRCFLSNLSSTRSSEKTINQENNTLNLSDSISTKKSTEENNEWLWAYLRDRTSFSDLTEEQRRCVIQIGEIINLFKILYIQFYFFLEVQTLRESGERVPNVIPDERLTELINSPLLESRKSLYE
jgi:hypothetical protein